MVEVRLAGPADWPLVAALRADWTDEVWGPGSDATFDDRFRVWWEAERGSRLTWLAVDGGTPVGMVNLAVFERMPRPGQPPSRWGYLGNAYVPAPRRSQGIGTALLQALLAYARAGGFVRIVLSPSERSLPFYRRAGFQPGTSLLVLTL